MTPENMRRLPAANALAPLSDAVVLDNSLAFVSGQGPIGPNGLSLGTIEHESALTLQNLLAVVSALGGTKESVARCTVYLADLADVAAFNRVYSDVFDDALPARTAIGVALQGGMKVEVEAVIQLAAQDEQR